MMPLPDCCIVRKLPLVLGMQSPVCLLVTWAMYDYIPLFLSSACCVNASMRSGCSIYLFIQTFKYYSYTQCTDVAVHTWYVPLSIVSSSEDRASKDEIVNWRCGEKCSFS